VSPPSGSSLQYRHRTRKQTSAVPGTHRKPEESSTYRADHAPHPPQLVLGFGNTSQRAIQSGIAVLGDILSTV